MSDILVGSQTCADGDGVIRSREQVEVADGVLPSSKAARCGDSAAADGRPQEGDQRVDLLFDTRELVARLGRRLRQRRLERLLDASAKAFQAVKTPPFHRSPQIVEGSHPELVVELTHPFWAHPRQRRDRRKLARDFALEVVKRRKMAGLDDFGDLARQILADAGQRGQVLSGGEDVRDGTGQRVDRLRRAPIGAHAERVRALDFKQLGFLTEESRDFDVLYGHGSELGAGTRSGARPKLELVARAPGYAAEADVSRGFWSVLAQ